MKLSVDNQFVRYVETQNFASLGRYLVMYIDGRRKILRLYWSSTET